MAGSRQCYSCSTSVCGIWSREWRRAAGGRRAGGRRAADSEQSGVVQVRAPFEGGEVLEGSIFRNNLVRRPAKGPPAAAAKRGLAAAHCAVACSSCTVLERPAVVLSQQPPPTPAAAGVLPLCCHGVAAGRDLRHLVHLQQERHRECPTAVIIPMEKSCCNCKPTFNKNNMNKCSLLSTRVSVCRSTSCRSRRSS